MACGLDTRPAALACLRLLIASLNLLIAAFSLFLLGCSIAVFLWLDHYLAVGPDLASALPIFLLSLSLATLLLSCLACCCLLRVHTPRPLIYVYSLCMGSVFLVELITVMVTFVFRERVSEALKQGIYQSMEQYGKARESNQAIDFLQGNAGCCGVSGPEDWQQTAWGTGHPDRLPHSCCFSTTKGVCRVGARGAEVYAHGCHQLLLDTVEGGALNLVSGLLLAGIVHLLAVGSAVCLARSKEGYSSLPCPRARGLRAQVTSSSTCLDGLLVTHCPSQSVSLVTRSQSSSSLDRPPPAPPRPRPSKPAKRTPEPVSPQDEYEPELWRPLEVDKTKTVYRPESRTEGGPGGMYRTASRATLVDQESGNVYQLIEKQQRGKTSETFLLQQPLSSPAPRPPPPPPKGLGCLPVQASIDLGMLHQARSALHPVPGQQSPCPDQPYYQVPKHLSHQGSLAGDWQARESIRDRLRELQGEDRCLLLPDPSPGSLEHLPRDLPSCLPPPSSVERYIAVPLSATEQYLISSSGQAYLTEQLPPLMAPPTTLTDALTVHSSESGDVCPPFAERPPPLGANSRQPSKLSLDMLEDEPEEDEEDRQKLLLEARLRVVARQLSDQETTC